MMIALYVWMGISTFATTGVVCALSLASRRHIPAIDTETGTPEPMLILNRGAANGEAKLSTSFAR